VSKNPGAELGTVQRALLSKILDQYLEQHKDDATVGAARKPLTEGVHLTVGDAVSVLDLIRAQLPSLR
jgi:hypothetical protein